MAGIEKELGRITVAKIYLEDHGILTCELRFDFGGTSQALYGYELDEWSDLYKRRIGTAAGTDLILCLLNVFGVDCLDKIVGRSAYALRKDGRIHGVEVPKFDGGAKFEIETWQKFWWPEEYK